MGKVTYQQLDEIRKLFLECPRGPRLRAEAVRFLEIWELFIKELEIQCGRCRSLPEAISALRQRDSSLSFCLGFFLDACDRKARPRRKTRAPLKGSGTAAAPEVPIILMK
jgi:hypothetical protein